MFTGNSVLAMWLAPGQPIQSLGFVGEGFHLGAAHAIDRREKHVLKAQYPGASRTDDLVLYLALLLLEDFHQVLSRGDLRDMMKQ